jgi:hypothetical protein
MEFWTQFYSAISGSNHFYIEIITKYKCARASDTGPKISLNTNAVDFDFVKPGASSKADVEITNTGSTLLEVRQITAAPTPPFALENVPALPVTLQAGEKTKFTVTFTPTQIGSGVQGSNKSNPYQNQGTLTIVSNAPTSPTVVNLNSGGTLSGMLPDGVAYDPNYWNPNIGPLRNDFTRLSISGSGLDQITEVTFEPPNDIEITRIVAKADEVEFDMNVLYGAALGERDLILKTGSSKKINVSNILGKKFIITKIRTEFNQAVDQSEVKDLRYRDKLVANKLGVMRIQFDDPKQYGKDFIGRLVVQGITANSQSPSAHIPQPTYSDADIIGGEDYLTIPFPQPLEKGKSEFRFFFVRDDGGNINFIFGPNITREILESKELRILGISYRIRKADGTTIEPLPDAQARQALDLTRLVYPVSREKVRYKHISTLDLPESISKQTQNIALSDGTPITVLTDTGTKELERYLSMLLMNANFRREFEGKPEIDILAAYLPRFVLFQDRNIDGIADNLVAGSTLPLFSVTMQAIQEIQGVISHEIGHTTTAGVLGDEYEGGFFGCAKNPPVGGINDLKGKPCLNSPLINGVHGDYLGTYTDRKAFNPATMQPMLTNKGQTQATNVINYNFMSAANPGEKHTWVSTLVYNELLKTLLPLGGGKGNLIAGLRGTTSRGIRLSGIIFKNDNETFNDFYIVTSSNGSLQSGGPFTFELQNETGTVLAFHSFNLDFIELSNPPQERDYDFFNITMDFPDGTKKIVLKKNSVQLTSRTISASAPVVQILTPQGGSTLSGKVQIRWTASDADGDSLRYTILYTPDDTLWLPVEANLKDTTYMWDSDAFPGGTSAKIAVIASDGINSGEAETTLGFSVMQKRPTVTITNPENDRTYRGDDVLVLNASGYDPEDGTLPDSVFTFSSNINGLLGRGSPCYVNRISDGTHTITVYATDKAGNVALDSIRLFVVTTYVEREKNTLPNTFALSQNYPNPFNPTTTIQFDVPMSSGISIIIYNILGQQVKELVHDHFEAGRYSMIWDGRNQSGVSVSSGVYFAKMQASDGRQSSFVKVKKMVLVR